MISSFIHHYASAIQLRTSLYMEVLRAKRFGNKLPVGINRKIMKEPQTHEEFIWLLRFIPTNADVNIIDIGGNSGYWAEEIMSYYVSSKVYGFEPVQEMYDQYKARFQFRSNVNIYNSALGDTVEEKLINVARTYHLTSFKTYSNDLEEKNENFTRQISVSIDKLDSYFSEFEFSDARKTIVKIDVQGYETYVIKGGLKVMDKADVAIIECSFINEYKNQLPTFGELVTILRELDLHPVCYGVWDRTRGPIAYERNVLFIKSKYFSSIWK